MLSKFFRKTVCYPSIGEVFYHRNLRARRLTISIRNPHGVRVTIPGSLPFLSAESFVLSRREWITSKLEHVKLTSTLLSNHPRFKTRNHTLTFENSADEVVRIKIVTPAIIVTYPELYDIEHPKVQDAGKKGIELAYRKEALEYLPARLGELATSHGFSFHKLSIRKAASRWGSCTHGNNINLSIYLMKLPDRLIDYVILHELCHTVHKNHGPKFWELLNGLTGGNAKTLSKEVRSYRASI